MVKRMVNMSNMFFSKKLVGLVRMDLALVNTTGLLIQMPVTVQAFRIGGADRYPMTVRRKYGDRELEVPYIPGSSLKGRIRALLELARGEKLFTTDNKIWAHVRNLGAMEFEEFKNDVESRNVISDLFGWAAANYSQILDEAKKHYKDKQMAEYEKKAEDDTKKIFSILAPTRLLFSEFYPSENYVRNNNVSSIVDFLEEKPENRIDRVTSAADPREIVRVKPGVEFEGTAVMLLFDIDGDKVAECFDTILEGFSLLEYTYLGSSGSRGYGRVKFVGRSVTVLRPRLSQKSNEVLEVLGRVEFRSLEELKAKREEVIKLMRKVFEKGSGS